MDHNDQSRLQYNYSAEAEQQRRSTQFQNPVTPSRVAPPGFPQHQQQQQQQLSSGQSIARAGPENAQLYGFAQGLQYGGSQQYGQEFVAGDSAARSQQQQLSQYASDLAYGMQQAQNQSDRQSSYGHDQRFRSRDSTTLETLPGQFAEPQAAQYYAGAQPGPSTATQAGFGSSHLASHYQSATYSPAGPATTSSFPGAMIDPSHPSAYQAFGQQHSLPAPQLGHHLHQSQIEQAFARYQNNIHSIFTLVRNQSLRETAQLLLDVSRYLLGSVEVLGLTRDQEGEHENRINLWDEYNRAWLTTMQCQFDMTQELFAGRSLHASQSTLDHDTLEGLARELLRLCDAIEKHGLVDYQMGVAEDEIIEIILRCLSQLETMSDDADEPEVMEQ